MAYCFDTKENRAQGISNGNTGIFSDYESSVLRYITSARPLNYFSFRVLFEKHHKSSFENSLTGLEAPRTESTPLKTGLGTIREKCSCRMLTIYDDSLGWDNFLGPIFDSGIPNGLLLRSRIRKIALNNTIRSKTKGVLVSISFAIKICCDRGLRVSTSFWVVTPMMRFPERWR